MPDVEKVIRGLEICSAGEWNSTGGRDHTDCPYYPAGYTGCTCKLLMRDALALLKAQEPKLVTNVHKEHNNVLNPNVPWAGKCPKCGKKIEGRNLTRFCKFCGQAVKWE